MKKLSFLRAFAFIGIATFSLTLTSLAPAQIPFSAGAYSQNFDLLSPSGSANAWTDNGTLAGWYAAKSASGGLATYRADTGASTAGALYSYGSTLVPADRALGSIA